MALRDSQSDVGGRLGASLTPRVPVAHVQERGKQNSGLVDIRALYAASVEHVMQRAQAVRARPPVVAFDPVAVEEEEPLVLPRQKIGWLPVTVVLLALAAAGSLFVASSNVPAVMHAKATLAPAVMHAKTTLVPLAMRAETTCVDVALRAEAALVARVDRLIGRPLPVAPPVSAQPPEAPPVAPAPPPVATAPAPSLPTSPLGEAAPPVAVVDAKAASHSAPAARAPVTRIHALPKAAADIKPAADIRPTTLAPKHPSSGNPPAMTATTPAKATAAREAPEAPTVKATPEPAKALAPSPGAADSKPMSLDDMIRRAVEAESKRKP
jgi:hypothetical protein